MFDSGADAIIVASALNNKIRNSKVDDEEMVEEIVFCIGYEYKKKLNSLCVATSS